MNLENSLLPSHSIEIVFRDRTTDRELTLKTVIESGYDAGLFRAVAPYHEGMIYNFHPNDAVNVVFTALENDHKVVYSIPCRIERRITLEDMPLLILRITGKAEKIQRRKAFRLKIYNTYAFEYHGRAYELVTKDISSSGMLTLTPIQLHPGDVFEIEFDANIELPDETPTEKDPAKIFNIHCRVLDSVPEAEIRRYISRIHFENLSSTESKLLFQYLYAKQTDIIHREPDSKRLFKKSDLENNALPASKRRTQIQAISLISVGLFVLAIVLVLFSMPDSAYPLDQFWGLSRVEAWEVSYLYMSTGVCFVVAVLSIVGLYINQSAISEFGKGRLSRVILLTFIASLIAILLNLYLIAIQPSL